MAGMQQEKEIRRKMNKDPQKIRVIYYTGSNTFEACFIGSVKVFESIIEQWQSVGNAFVEWEGRLNDIDSNAARFVVRRDAIVLVDSLSVNGLS